MLFNVSMYPHKHTLNVCNKFYYVSFDSSSVKSSQLHSSFVEVPIIIITSYIAYLGLPQFGLKIRWKLWPLSEIHHAIPDGELCKFDVQSSDQFPINNDNPSGQTKDSDFYTLPWIKLLESPAAQNYLVVACIQQA